MRMLAALCAPCRYRAIFTQPGTITAASHGSADVIDPKPPWSATCIERCCRFAWRETVWRRISYEVTLVANDFILGLVREIPLCDAVGRSVSAARTVSAIGLQVNHVESARISAGAPSSRTWPFRTASTSDRRPSQT